MLYYINGLLMRKILFKMLSVAVLCATASCSSEDAPDTGGREENAIRFNSYVGGSSRSESTTSATIKSFTVYAFTAGKKYMDGVKVIRNGNSWTYHPLMYWPDTPVNFYAYSPEVTNSPSTGGSGIGDIPGYVNYGTTDLLYAVNIGETAKNTPVLLNFRHALSRLDVLLSSTNPDIKVEVAYITVNNIATSGTFNFPDATTSRNNPEVVGNWTDLSGYGASMIKTSIDTTEYVTLTSTPKNLTVNNMEFSYVIPQPLTALNYDGSKYTGNYIEVDCAIYDNSGHRIWPTPATPSEQLVAHTHCGRLMFPVTTSTIDKWEIGHGYVYNIVIDNPEVLHPLEFSVTVDQFDMSQL